MLRDHKDEKVDSRVELVSGVDHKSWIANSSVALVSRNAAITADRPALCLNVMLLYRGVGTSFSSIARDSIAAAAAADMCGGGGGGSSISSATLFPKLESCSNIQQKS